ncbi:junctional adhesion molecule A [Spea bombifrons]|uniref:junctional adhesion molecule A n=1 Tax=Spea bombifrons TaxID=233779 RepID=UPI00234B3DB7|nr:junctional adhesion molecule A [Spea bombifrons]
MELNWSVLGVLVYSLITSTLGGVTTPNKEIRVKEGASAELLCQYTSDFQNPRVEWKFVNNDQETSLIYYELKLTAPYKDRAVFYPQGLGLNKITRKDNGEYTCEVTGDDAAGNPLYGEAKIGLVVLVPPSVPVAQVPTSVTNGGVATLSCIEKDSSPPASFTWYKNKVLLPENPKSSPSFQNSSYTLDPKTGVLKFDPVTKNDVGEFYCEAKNTEGQQISAVVRMDVHDVNVGGIVAAVIVVLLLLALIAFGLWFAYSRGYFNKKTNKKVIYSLPSETRSDRNFQQTSSFLV